MRVERQGDRTGVQYVCRSDRSDTSSRSRKRERLSELEVGGVYWPFPQEALGNL